MRKPRDIYTRWGAVMAACHEDSFRGRYVAFYSNAKGYDIKRLARWLERAASWCAETPRKASRAGRKVDEQRVKS